MVSRSDRIRMIAGKISGLPTLPTVVAKMIELVDNPKTSTRTLAKLISHDQSLTARILKLANSAYYGFSREISTVDTAIVVMGYSAVKEMGLSLSVYDTFKNVGSIHSFDVNRYWEHSVAVGVAARFLARKFRVGDPGEIFVAGLLHDIGKMILLQYMQEDFNLVVDTMIAENIPYVTAEEKILGITHGEIGYILAKRWHLPDCITACIYAHHFPERSQEYSREAALIDLADFICHKSNLGNDDHRPHDVYDIKCLHLISATASVNDTDIVKIQEELFKELERNDMLSTFYSQNTPES